MNTATSDLEPPFVGCYRFAMREVYGGYPSVKEQVFPRFISRSKQLLSANIDLNHYSTTVAQLWQWWVKQRHLTCLPINVFLGKKSLELYAKSYCVELVSPDQRKTIILNDEMLVAEMCVRNCCYDRKVIRELCLSDDWWDANNAGERPIREAADMICKLHGLECTTLNYRELGEILRDRQR